MFVPGIVADSTKSEHPVKLNDLVLVGEEAVLALTLVALAEVLAVIVEMTALWMGTENGESESVIVFHTSPIPYHIMWLTCFC